MDASPNVSSGREELGYLRKQCFCTRFHQTLTQFWNLSALIHLVSLNENRILPGLKTGNIVPILVPPSPLLLISFQSLHQRVSSPPSLAFFAMKWHVAPFPCDFAVPAFSECLPLHAETIVLVPIKPPGFQDQPQILHPAFLHTGPGSSSVTIRSLL